MKNSIFLVNKIQKFIYNSNLFYFDQSILVAVSGGQDSICLLMIFLQLRNQFNLNLGIMYCNHLWNKTSFYQCLHMLKISYIFHKSLYFPLFLKQTVNETHARKERYKFLVRIASFYNYKKISTGHNNSDCIETLFLNLCRGSSQYGLTSLLSKRTINNKFFYSIFLNNYDLYEISKIK